MTISKVYQLVSRPYVIAFLVVSILSLHFSNSLFAVNAKTNLARYSGIELFKAIYFMEGNLVTQIPTLNTLKQSTMNEMTGDDYAEYTQIQNEVIDQVRSYDPTFFAQLENAVNSNDHYQISETIKKGAEWILISLGTKPELRSNPNFPDLSGYDFSIDEQRHQAVNAIKAFLIDESGHGEVSALAWVVVVVALALAVAAAAVVISFNLWVTEIVANDDILTDILANKSLTTDRLVADLVNLP
ncbi:MAG TPA: hypothetical protein PKC40_10790 [Saprospiraceae bacterium]|nr:hypothetical protein [Saprospiraceae bacterium]